MRLWTGLLALALLLPGCGDAPGASRPLVPQGEPLVQTSTGSVLVAGEVKNTSPDRAYSGLVQVTLKDAAGKIVGSAVGGISDVPPGGTLPYTAIGQKPAEAWATVEVAVTAQMAQ